MMDFLLLKNYLDPEGRLKNWPSKRALKNIALQFLAEKFIQHRFYSEKEINAILNSAHIFSDPALLRRELYEAKILNRTLNCQLYWKI